MSAIWDYLSFEVTVQLLCIPFIKKCHKQNRLGKFNFLTLNEDIWKSYKVKYCHCYIIGELGFVVCVCKSHFFIFMTKALLLYTLLLSPFGNVSTFRRPWYGGTIPDISRPSKAIVTMISDCRVACIILSAINRNFRDQTTWSKFWWSTKTVSCPAIGFQPPGPWRFPRIYSI